MKFYNQKVCVVTGAASGIGRACISIGKVWRKTVITDIRKDMLDETAELIKSAGGSGRAYSDAADRDGVYELAAHVEKTHGGADFVLNNAGVAMGASVMNWALMILTG